VQCSKDVVSEGSSIQTVTSAEHGMCRWFTCQSFEARRTSAPWTEKICDAITAGATQHHKVEKARLLPNPKRVATSRRYQFAVQSKLGAYDALRSSRDLRRI
jgi:hypothetical protein